LTERLGWRAERRPEPGFAHALGAGAAAFAVFAVFALVIEVTSDDATAPGVGFYLILSIVSILAGAQMAGPVRAAATTALVLSVPLIWIFAFVGDGQAGNDTLRWIYILVIVSYAALYFVSWTKGHAIFLGLALLVLFIWVTAEVQGLDSSPVPFQQISPSTSTPFDTGGNFPASDDDNTTETSTTSLVIGLIYLGAAAALDRKKLTGVATPFVLVGTIATLSGAIVLGARESLFWGGFSAVAAGSAVGLVGGLGLNRRFSTWFGTVFVVGGLIAIVVDIVSGDSFRGGTSLEYAGVFALVALLMGGAAAVAAPRFHEFVDGNVDAGKISDSK
jgi:hypothetical protein